MWVFRTVKLNYLLSPSSAEWETMNNTHLPRLTCFGRDSQSLSYQMMNEEQEETESSHSLVLFELCRLRLHPEGNATLGFVLFLGLDMV